MSPTLSVKAIEDDSSGRSKSLISTMTRQKEEKIDIRFIVSNIITNRMISSIRCGRVLENETLINQ
ncbi:CLUMA_CG010376, isoform A [Clunio marinus]|uniref:CLUMA_CG010376, isoform A n=1 Tax=Clunio marinus TaxID=568069 RepID=A0A1J1I9T6_9DIPT|nr:CLUMA_CG010376, isoform A [Clunio marinus]